MRKPPLNGRERRRGAGNDADADGGEQAQCCVGGAFAGRSLPHHRRCRLLVMHSNRSAGLARSAPPSSQLRASVRASSPLYDRVASAAVLVARQPERLCLSCFTSLRLPPLLAADSPVHVCLDLLRPTRHASSMTRPTREPHPCHPNARRTRPHANASLYARNSSYTPRRTPRIDSTMPLRSRHPPLMARTQRVLGRFRPPAKLRPHDRAVSSPQRSSLLFFAADGPFIEND